MKQSPPAIAPSLMRASKRANALIEAMLKEMRQGLKQPARLESPEWERLFGAKQSMVVNLQKLVQAMALLPPAPTATASSKRLGPEAALDAEEMKLLTQWLAQRDA